MTHFRNWARALTFGLALAISATPTLSHAKKKEDTEEAALKVLKSGRKDPKPDVTSKGAKLLGKAVDLLNEEKWDETLAELDKLLGGKATAYEKSKAHQIRSNVFFNKEDYESAVEAAKAAVDTNGLNNREHLDAMLTYAQLLYNAERFADSIKAYEAYINDAPTVKGEVYFAVAANNYELEQWDQAVQYTDKAFASGDKPANNWYQLKVNSLYQAERYADALGFLKDLLTKEPANMQYNNMLVSSYLQMEDNKGALEHLLVMKNAKLFDTDLLWRQLYQLYLAEGKPLESAAVIEEGLATGGLKSSAAIYIDLGEDYFVAADDLDEKETAKRSEYMSKALGAFEQAAAVAEDGTADLWRCQILLDQDKAAPAASACDAAFAKGKLKDEGNAHYLHGVALFESGKIAEAKAALTKALAFPNSKRNAETMLSNLR